MYSAHRAQNSAIPSDRLNDLFEQLKSEYVAMENELNLCKMQRDNFEQKLEAQLNEFQSMKQTIVDLEQSYQNMKQSYEEQIFSLKQQLKNFQQQQPNSATQSVNNLPTNDRRSPSLNDLQQLHNQSTPNSQQMNPYKRRPDENVPNFPSFPTPNTQNFPPIINNFPQQPPAHTEKRNFPNFKDLSEPVSAPTPPLANPNPSHATQPATRPMQVSSILSSQPQSVNSLPASASPTPQENGNSSPSLNNSFVGAFDNKSMHNGLKGDSVVRKEGNDWVAVYNPKVKTNVNINLNHNLDHQSVVCCVRFNSDGKYLATGCNKVAQIYDVATGEKFRAFGSEIDSANGQGVGNAVIPQRPIESSGQSEKEDSYVRSVGFSPNGQLLAAGAEDRTVKVWDIKSGVMRHSFVGHELDIYSLDFSYDNRFIVSGSGDGKAKLWNLDAGRCEYTLGNEEIGPKEGVTSVAFSPDGRYVAAGSLDHVVRLWDTQTGKFLESFKGHEDSVYSVAFSPDGKTLASASLDKSLKLWDLSGSRSGFRCISTLNGHRDYVLSVAFSPDGKWLISGSKDRSVQFWDPRSNVLHLMLQCHKNSVISVAVSPTQQVFATGSGDFRARVWSY